MLLFSRHQPDNVSLRETRPREVLNLHEMQRQSRSKSRHTSFVLIYPTSKPPRASPDVWGNFERLSQLVAVFRIATASFIFVISQL